MKETLQLKTLDNRCGDFARIEINIIDKNAPLVMVFPGGGYEHLSPRESGPIADKFNLNGINTAIIYYSIAPYNYRTIMLDAMVAYNYLYSINKSIFVIGFSAGGHLAGLLGTNNIDLKGMILCYPVISLVSKYHKGSRIHLLGEEDNEELATQLSINNRVTATTPKTFIWTCSSDESVPYENTLYMIDALKANNIYYESIIYDHGKHGMALADETAIMNGDTNYMDKEIATWFDAVLSFINKVK